MNQIDFLHIFHSKLPIIREWIENILEKNKHRAIPVIDLAFSKLNNVFPESLLSKAKVVVTKGKVPFPPLSNMGMSEFIGMENMPMAGVTYKDVFFIGDLYKNENLCFHEMVHIVQWDRLGVNDFLLAYGIGLAQFGYSDSPLEKMAYALQEKFELSSLPSGVIETIQQKTDNIWSEVVPLFTWVKDGN